MYPSFDLIVHRGATLSINNLAYDQPTADLQQTSWTDSRQQSDGGQRSADSDPDESSDIASKNALSGNDTARAAFNSFLEQNDTNTIYERETKDVKTVDQGIATRIIDRARDYQQELFETAKEENVIAVLETGSGKTLIACLLVRHILADELVRRGNGYSAKVAIFMANSVYLVQQQAAVLANNLVAEPFVFTGQDSEVWKDKKCWNNIFTQNSPIVCTPAILQQCLDGALISIDQISLLIFDEAHHAKKNHPYSRIIRSYYVKCPAKDRPKIFGMTASPVDAKGNIDVNATELEHLLHSKIITTSDTSLLSFAPMPKDVVWEYRQPRQPWKTDLYLKLWPECHFHDDAKKGFMFAERAASELGSWCADQVWKYVFGKSESHSSSIIKSYEQGRKYAAIKNANERETNLQRLQQAHRLVQTYFETTPKPLRPYLSSKVTCLYDKICEAFQKEPSTQAIVFVDQRLTAYVLRDCFVELNIPRVVPGVLTGAQSNLLLHSKQEETLSLFRQGIINLMFATSVADEGIDIPQCNLCVRFDLYKSPIQYIQSRGRARKEGSCYVHMIREGDHNQYATMHYAQDSDLYIKDFCRSLPSDRLLGRGSRLERMIAQDASNKSFKTVAGVVCDFGNSLMVLSRFVATLHNIGALDKETFEEEIDDENRLFRYTVRLPANDELVLKGAKGEWRQNKQLARRSAAFNCCCILRKKAKLDEQLLSVYTRLKPENLNAHLAVSATKTAYPIRTKPLLWLKGLGTIPDYLYAIVVSFESKRQLRQPLAPIVMLTREKLPIFPSFTLYCEENVEVTVRFRQFDQPFSVEIFEIDLLTQYTLDGIFKDVFNKVYEKDSRNLSYWLVPLRSNPNSSSSSISGVVDMQALHDIQLGRVKWVPERHSSIEWTNKFIVDPRSGKFHYFTSEIATGKTIHDPVPESVPKISQKGRKSIIDFSDSSWKASKKNFVAATYDINQPIIHAELIKTRRNVLDKGSEKETAPVLCLIAPQPLEVSRLAPLFAASCLAWPAVIYRVESYLITLEAFDQLGLRGIPPELTLEAFTKDNDVDAIENQVHSTGNKGMGKNYERLEFIGDSLLKMMTTITVFLRTKCDEEGMHCRRMEILCNRRLFDVSTEKHHLYQYARTTAFNRMTWYPENLVLLKGRGAKKDPELVKHPQVMQDLGMKTIADFSEAIIGAAAVTGRKARNKFDLGIQAITQLVDSEDHAIQSWDEIATLYTKPSWSILENDVVANDLSEKVKLRTGYQFKQPRLLRSALTHSSDNNSTVPDLQRLEFLGDAVLDWVSISWLFHSNPDRNPQWLTEHKMAMVSNKFLAALAVKLDFDKFIQATTFKLLDDISKYAKMVRTSLNRPEVSRDFWTRFDSPPKALSDVIESYLGAVLVDSGFNYDEVERFFNRHVLWFFEDMSKYDGFANRHPTSYLYKKFTDEYKCRDFRILSSEPKSGEIDNIITAAVLVHGQVIAHSSGPSARYAKVRASKSALDQVEGMTRDEFARRFDCNCHKERNESGLE